MDNIETFDEADLVPPYKHIVNRNVNWDDARSIETIEDNSIDSFPPQQPQYDLSNDIYVNELLANSGAPHNPDAEVFDPNMGPSASSSYNRPPNPSFTPMNFPSRFERLPYYAPPTFPNFQQFPAPPQLNYRPPPFTYPNFPFEGRSQPFEAERLRTNDLVPEFYRPDLHFRSAQGPTEFVRHENSITSGSSVHVRKSNVPETSS